MRELDERIESALGAMGTTPRPLAAYLEQPGPAFDKASTADVEKMITRLLSPDPNEPARLLISNRLRSWDNANAPSWAHGTDRNTSSRRKQIHELLKSNADLQKRIDSVLPFFPIEEPLIIAEEHRDWYQPHPGIRDYSWHTYIA